MSLVQAAMLFTARLLFSAFIVFAINQAALFADDDPTHSKHGEAFNEGPRQAAVLMDGTGDVHFPITTKNKLAQQFFDQGVGQQHGFWYFEAERSFRQASALDPESPMPFWGMAMANVNNDKRAKAFVAAAILKKHNASPREQAWVETLRRFYNEAADDKRDKKQRAQDYITDLEAIVQDYPEDIEAKAFLVWKIYHAASLIPIGSRQAVDALLDQIFASHPRHPAHHYRIHLWDNGDKSKRALGSAALCGQVAPGIAHMWHMPGHTFTRLKRFDDAAWQQEAATRVDHAYMMRALVLPDRIHNYAHNEEWLIRTWNEQGRAKDGIALAKALIANPRHPELNTLDKGSSSAAYGRTRLLDTLILWELWPELLALNGGPYLKPVIQTAFEANRLRAVGLAHYAQANSKALATTITELEALKAKDEAKAKADKAKADKDAKEAKAKEAATKASKVTTTKASNVNKTPSTAEPPKAKPTPTENGKRKTENAQKNSSPTEAALAELRLCQLILSKAANDKIRSAIEAAAKDIPADRAAHYHLRLDDSTAKTKAAEFAAKVTQDLHGYAIQAEVYAACGRNADARKALDEVRQRGYAMDSSLPLAKRLDALVKTLATAPDKPLVKKEEIKRATPTKAATAAKPEANSQAKTEPKPEAKPSPAATAQPPPAALVWRQPAPERKDSGKRPSLDSLGPVHWSPPAAPSWSGTGLDGKPVSSTDFAGQPTLLLFYVGHACAHCVSQLKAFEALAADFKKVGIHIIAISPDTPAELPLAQKFAVTKGGFPFPLVAAKSTDTFKAFRAYDDFESLALHCAALVDGQQRLRWLDVGSQPFMEAKFLLEEAQRLLALP